MENKFYHITKQRHLPSIMTKGLIAGYRVGLTYSARPKHKIIFVTNDPKKIIEWQAGQKWINKYKAVLLEVDVNNLELKPVEYRDGATYTISDFEFEIHTKLIEPKRLTFAINLYN